MTSIPYQTALETGARRDMSHFGRFVVAGPDAAALLHHITTNDIKRLPVGGVTEAILVSSKARVLDWLTIVRRAEQEFLVITSPNRREIFTPHARQYVLFRQVVSFEDVTETTGMEGIFGPAEVLAARGDLLEPGKTRQSAGADQPEWSCATRRLPGAGILRIYARRAPLAHSLAAATQEFCDNATFNLLRVEAGIPVAGLELTEDINPWEAGFDFAISLNKGCYNGQEVIARLHNYKKVKQELRGLRLERPVDSARTGLVCAADGSTKDAGVLTSVVESPRFGHIGLGFVRSAYLEAGTKVILAGPEGPGAVVTNLPFTC